MTDYTDLKSRLSGHIALDDVKPLMAEALGAIERLEKESISGLSERYKGFHVEVEVVPRFVMLTARGCEDCGTRDAIYETASTRHQTLADAMAELDRKCAKVKGE